jgi:hypothetical protein
MSLSFSSSFEIYLASLGLLILWVEARLSELKLFS